MVDVVTYVVQGGVARVEINNPPVNALSQAVRAGLLQALERAKSDRTVSAIVLIGKGRTFPAGADIREFDAPTQAPHLPDECKAIEDSKKPVVACLHGTALGGGLELALAAHARLALKGTKVGLPEITLGVIPGAGGTQRLPRIIAIKDALEMMLSGTPVDAEKARRQGLIDGVVEGDLASAGVRHAQSLVATPVPATRARRQRFADAIAYQREIDAARQAHRDHPTGAAAALFDCLDAALLLPFDAGLALERDLFLELRDTPAAQALRHGFIATRDATKPRDGLPPGEPVREVAILGGGGLMGSGISVSCLDAGCQVTVIERDDAAVRAAQARITGVYDRAIGRGRMTDETRDARLSRLVTTSELDAVRVADLVIEALPEDLSLKEETFAKLGDLAGPDTVLATNTSYLDVDAIAAASGRPADVIGLHFFAPAHVQALVEVAIGTASSPAAEATGFAFVQAIGKKPVRVAATEGFIGNRILTAYREAADKLVEAGASPYFVDEVMRQYGFKMGPYEVLDMTGLDLAWSRRRRATEQGDPPETEIIERLCEAGRIGQKAKSGFYRYSETASDGEEDEAVTQIIDAERARKGISPRPVTAAEIETDCLSAMMNEGARLLDEGVAERAGDIDVVMLLGYGFPRHRGGPMKAAELRGLLKELRALDARSAQDPFWTPADALRDAVKNGNRFSGVL